MHVYIYWNCQQGKERFCPFFMPTPFLSMNRVTFPLEKERGLGRSKFAKDEEHQLALQV